MRLVDLLVTVLKSAQRRAQVTTAIRLYHLGVGDTVGISCGVYWIQLVSASMLPPM